LRCAWAHAQAVAIPIIGCGGIQSAQDALEFLVAGCSAVQFGTASFADPARIGGLAREMERLLDAAGIADVNDLVGSLLDGRQRLPRPRPENDAAGSPNGAARGGACV
jgi:dihydroorotate dehydrogenase (NAD+) catalytic subunit